MNSLFQIIRFQMNLEKISKSYAQYDLIVLRILGEIFEVGDLETFTKNKTDIWFQPFV